MRSVSLSGSTLCVNIDYLLPSHFLLLEQQVQCGHIQYHDLRHSCVGLLIANGVSLKEIRIG